MSNRKWQLQEAKNKLSEVVDAALTHGPQIITRHGVDTVMIVSITEYRIMKVRRKKLTTFFRESPMAGINIDLKRDRSGIRSNITL